MKRISLDEYADMIRLADTTIMIEKNSAHGGFTIFGLIGKGYYVEGELEKRIFTPKGVPCGMISLGSATLVDAITRTPRRDEPAPVYIIRLDSTTEVDRDIKEYNQDLKKRFSFL